MPTEAMPNPLELLGLSTILVARERDRAGGLSRLLKIARANFKVLSKEYHPDRPGGDMAFMAELTQAIDELSDIEMLSYYVDELLDEGESDVLHRRQQQQVRTAQQRRTYLKAVALLVHSHQFEALQLSGPTSLLAAFGSDRLVMDVLSPSHTRIARVGEQAQYATLEKAPVFSGGVWSEWTDLPAGSAAYDATISLGDVRVIGGIREDDARKGSDSGPLLTSGAIELEAPLGLNQIIWSKPEHAWYMPHLRAFQPGDSIVMMKAGSVALTGAVLAQASL